ncbi:unnamed protein product [Caretta caretta]
MPGGVGPRGGGAGAGRVRSGARLLSRRRARVGAAGRPAEPVWLRSDLESRKKQREDVDVVGASDGEGAIGLSNDHKSREQMINDRIGYKPQPKPNNRSSQFGSFEF